MENVSFPGTAGMLRGSLFQPAHFQHAVLVLHGFAGYRFSSKKRFWLQALKGAGYLSLAFDFFGHGESDGQRFNLTLAQEVKDVHSAVQFLRAKHPFQKLALVGHSMGGVVAEQYALAHPAEVSALVLVGAPLHFERYPGCYFPAEKVAAWKTAGKLHVTGFGPAFDLDYAFKEDQLRHDFPKELRALKTPKLFLHGTADELVPVEEAREAFALALEPKRLKLIAGGSHSLENHRPEAFAEMLSFLAETLR